MDSHGIAGLLTLLELTANGLSSFFTSVTNSKISYYSIIVKRNSIKEKFNLGFFKGESFFSLSPNEQLQGRVICSEI